MKRLNRKPIFALLGALFVAFMALIVLNSVLLRAQSEALGFDQPAYESSYKDPLAPEKATSSDNIALHKPVYASYYLDVNKAPKYAVDGDLNTRWESTWNETAWISIDLGAMATITNVKLLWEEACAANFKIQISNDAENWTTVYTATNNSDTSNDITFSSPITGRYIRMVGCERCLVQYGYSLYEFEVYGYGDDPNVTPTPTPGPRSGDPVLIWNDEFSGTGNVNANGLNMDNWTIETGVCKNSEQQTYTTSISNVSVVSGTLIIEAHDTNPTSECTTCGNRFTSGSIISKDKQEFEYGRFEARIKLPVGEGLWPAFWLLGANFYKPDEVSLSHCGVSIPIGWPRSGEIDIMENVGYPDWVPGGVHGPGYSGTGGVGGRYTFTVGSVVDWHTYAVEWDPVEVKGYVDNTVFYTVTRTALEEERGQWVFDHPFLIVLNLALGGDYPYQFNHNDGSNGGCYGLPQRTIKSLPQRMEVDWVRVYQRRRIYLPLILRNYDR